VFSAIAASIASSSALFLAATSSVLLWRRLDLRSVAARLLLASAVLEAVDGLGADALRTRDEVLTLVGGGDVFDEVDFGG